MNLKKPDRNYPLNDHHKSLFLRKGFIKLEQFLDKKTINKLKRYVNKQLNDATSNFQREFHRLKYDAITSEDNCLFDLIQQYFFCQTLRYLTGRTLLFTFSPCFELKKNISHGFPWHVGVQSFGYQRIDDFGCTMWIPLDPVNPTQQGGGMQYVPKDVISGKFIYKIIEPAIVSAMKAKVQKKEPITLEDYYFLREGVLNSPALSYILEQHKEEDSFRPGDVLIFDRDVIHRSVPLGNGKLVKRAAIAMRFIDINSRYVQEKADDIDFPARQFNEQLFTQTHLQLGLQDNELIADSGYFRQKEKRII